jgi:hypothetical protein
MLTDPCCRALFPARVAGLPGSVARRRSGLVDKSVGKVKAARAGFCRASIETNLSCNYLFKNNRLQCQLDVKFCDMPISALLGAMCITLAIAGIEARGLHVIRQS